MPSLLKKYMPDKSHTSDRGWGCMLRCGQMMVAEVFKRYLIEREIFLPEHKKDSYKALLTFFADSVDNGYVSPFSIQQISEMAYEEYGLKPGEWYRASNIIVTLAKLHKKFATDSLKRLKFVTFVDGTIFEDQILKEAINGYAEKLEAEKAKKAKDKDREKAEKDENAEKSTQESTENKNQPEEIKQDHNSEQKNHSQDIPSNSSLEDPSTLKWDNPVFVFVASKTGLEEPNYDYLPTLLNMMNFPQSVGMLGTELVLITK